MQAFPLKGNLIKQHCPGVLGGGGGGLGGGNACFVLMYQVDSGHLHFTSKKIPVCDIGYHKRSEYWAR